MKPRIKRSLHDTINWHRAPRIPVVVFEGTCQDGRIQKARNYIQTALSGFSQWTIIELGAGACDISGPFAHNNYVIACDMVKEARAKAIERFPDIKEYWQVPVEYLKPMKCDIIVLCEFLEHIPDPHKLISEWLPLAKYAVIGHPLCVPEKDPEDGHLWSYTDDDFEQWFKLGCHDILHQERFPMACYEKMAIGLGRHKSCSD